jgi:glycosyltransferase involved in cell wall biosynthesis
VNVLLVSGIWPPDVGGPASHAPALAAHLLARGHGVEVVTTAAAAPALEPYPVQWISRSLPAGVRHARVAIAVGRAARHADVVYATSMIRRAAAGAAAARRPLVAKLVADEVFERARRKGWFDGTLDEFQREQGDLRVRMLRRARTKALRRARHIFCPSAYLLQIAAGWGLDPARMSVLPNPAPELPPLPSPATVRGELGLDGPLLGFAGRLTAQKALDVALAAVAEVPRVSLVVLGDGPERASLERRAADLGLDGRVRFLGSGGRSDVLRLFRGCDAALLSSAWENFPHTVVEALAVGTPVLAAAVGGVPEVVRDGENGLLAPPGDAGALAAVITRFFAEPGLRERLAAGAAPSVAPLAEGRLLAEVEAELGRAVGTA